VGEWQGRCEEAVRILGICDDHRAGQTDSSTASANTLTGGERFAVQRKSGLSEHLILWIDVKTFATGHGYAVRGPIVLSFAAMKPSEALRIHRVGLRDIVARHAALRPRVFGSTISGDDTEDSDLDLLIDPTPRTTLMTLAAIQQEAQQLLGVRVDVLTPKSLPQRIRERVLQEAVPV
jgi:uncharacterized protein